LPIQWLPAAIRRESLCERHLTKRDTTIGKFIDQKTDGGKFKGVRQEC